MLKQSNRSRIFRYRKPKITTKKIRLNLFVDDLNFYGDFESHIYLAASYCECPIGPGCNRC